ncbi:PA14 domain-containing protein [Paenibacillus larvae]|nr:PA14 domain-containing protein [Paenibacillus larvae]MDT2259673.1 PA14 domain-containing protein [Paenibacillus larvae]
MALILKRQYQSVRWLANFTPKESGVYTFTINPHCFAHILIDGENAKDQEIQLEAGKSYPFVVAYFGNPMTEQEVASIRRALYLQSTRNKRLRLKPFLFLKSFLLRIFQWVLILERRINCLIQMKIVFVMSGK